MVEISFVVIGQRWQQYFSNKKTYKKRTKFIGFTKNCENVLLM